MYAYMMLDDVSFTVKDSGIVESYNIYSYRDFVSTLGDEKLTALTDALMKYSRSAKAYKDFNDN